MKHFRNIIKESKKQFLSHSWLRIIVKKDPHNPYGNMIFEKIIHDSIFLNHTKYAIYIHDKYISIRSLKYECFEPIKILLDNKLWIELYNVFEIDTDANPNVIFDKLQDIEDKPV